jgi:hypothetical protein
MRAKLAAHTRWSREDPTENAIRGQRGLQAKFERDVDPEGVLPPAERARRAESLRQAHMARLALASSRARKARRGGATG